MKHVLDEQRDKRQPAGLTPAALMSTKIQAHAGARAHGGCQGSLTLVTAALAIGSGSTDLGGGHQQTRQPQAFAGLGAVRSPGCVLTRALG